MLLVYWWWLYWWLRIDAEVENWISACGVCRQHDKSAKVERPQAQVTPSPKGPSEKLGIDIRGPHWRLPQAFRYAVVIVDYYSKWPIVRFMAEATPERIVQLLRSVFTCEEIPLEIVGDNGPQFRNSKFSKFFEDYNVKHCRTAVYNQSANGLVERFNRVLGDMIMTMELKHRSEENLDVRLQEMLAEYRNTPHPTTGQSPSILLHGRAMRGELQIPGVHKLERQVEAREVRDRVEATFEKRSATIIIKP